MTGEAGALEPPPSRSRVRRFLPRVRGNRRSRGGKGASLVTSSVGFGLAKWASIGAAVGVLGLGTVEWFANVRSMLRPCRALRPARMAARAPELSPRELAKLNAPPSEAPSLDPPVMVEPSAPSSLPHAARVPALRGSVEQSANHPSEEAPVELAEEVALLDQVREAMSAQIQTARSRFCKRTRPSFRRRPCCSRPSCCKIEALASKGDQARAVPLAEAFLLEHPVSAHASRVRSLLASMKRAGP